MTAADARFGHNTWAPARPPGPMRTSDRVHLIAGISHPPLPGCPEELPSRTRLFPRPSFEEPGLLEARSIRTIRGRAAHLASGRGRSPESALGSAARYPRTRDAHGT